MVDRREFLRLGAGAALGLAAVTARAQCDPGIRRYVRLGRTELKMSDISFGSSGMSDPAVVRHALARGINYFDTAESYGWGSSEEAIGEALKGRRDEVLIASKTKAGVGDTRAAMMKSLEHSLKRLQTDRVEVYFNHSVNEVERMQNQEWWEFTQLAKRQGKIRFRGMSGHGSNLTRCLDYVIDNDLADVILVAYNFAQDPSFYDKLRHTFHWSAIQPDLPRVLDKAKKKDIGVIAMKTLMGARLNDMRPYERPGATFSQAAFRWVLSAPQVDALLVSMNSASKIDEYVAASGTAKVRGADMELLERYALLQSGHYCQSGCNDCAGSCPQNVAIAEVLRTRMYDVDYGDPLLARTEYAALGKPAEACLTCTTQSCLNACTRGVPIAEYTLDAALRLA
ncbi:MAG TPA: aldo/keto reductase [Burkholderiales bacterium]|nr:aldo/keto reductase [Burkholderiales bacterium]